MAEKKNKSRGKAGGRRTPSQATQPPPLELPGTRQRRALLWPAIVLLAMVVAANIHLLLLYLEVHAAASPNAVESFCNIGEGMNCIAVAASKYSALWGVPLALYAAEYYAVLLAMVALSAFTRWFPRRWDSLLFVMLLLALPVSITMATISLTQVQSFCIMCCLVYTVNVLLVLAMLLLYRGALGDLLLAGPKELFSWLKQGSGAFVIAVLLLGGASQLWWAPGLFPGRPTQPSTTAVIDLSKIPQHGVTIGAANAPLLIEEFTDYQCPHCQRAHDTLLALVKRYPQRVRVKHYDFPLDNACNRKVKTAIHSRACAAAVYARCAAEQGRFWPFAAQLFHNQQALTDDDMLRYAQSVGLDGAKLSACAGLPGARAKVANDIEEAIRRKVRGTPTFFINGKERIVGPRPLDFWEGLLEKKAATP